MTNHAMRMTACSRLQRSAQVVLLAPRSSFSPRSPAYFHSLEVDFYDEAGNVIETHEQTGDFKEP
jgi:hypothetical protein